MAPNNTLNFTTRVDMSGLRTGMQEAATTVQTGAEKMAQAMAAARQAQQDLTEAMKEFGPIATQGNQQAISILSQYVQANFAAKSAVRELTSEIEKQTVASTANAAAMRNAAIPALRWSQGLQSVGVSARQGAAAGIGILEGRMMSGNRAASAFLATTLGLGPVIEAAFPIIGALALGEVLVDVIGKVANLYDEFVNLRSIQNEVWKGIAEGEAQAITISNEHLRLLREQQVLTAEVSGGKSGRSARGEAAGANFDLAQAKNDLAIINGQITAYQDRVDDLQRRASAKPTFSLLTKDAGSSDAKTAGIELPKAQQDLANALAQQKNLQEQIGNAQLQGDLRHIQMAEAGAEAAKAATAQQLAAMRESDALIDREMKKEIEAYDKLNAIWEKGTTAIRTLSPDDTSSNAAIEKYADDWEKLNDAQIEATQIQQGNANALAEATIHAQAATGALTPLGAAQTIAAQHAHEYEQQLVALNEQLKVYIAANKEVEAAQTRNQIAQVQGQQKVSVVTDNAAIIKAQIQPYMQAATQVADVWMNAQNRILQGGRASWAAVAHAADQTVMSIINGAERMAVKWIESQIEMTIVHAQQKQAQATTDDAAAAISKSKSAESSMAEVFHAAASAAAHTYSATAAIPIVGPFLAPEAAAAAFAAVEAFGSMASFDVGTTYVPKTGMAIIHEGEAVFPRPHAQMIRELMAGGGRDGQGGSGNTIHFNYSPNFQSGGTPSDSRKSARELHGQFRRMGLVQG